MLGVKTEVNDRITFSSRKRTFYQAVIHRLFSKMTRGSLTMYLPDDSRDVYGHDPAGINAVIRVNRMDFFRKCVLYGDIGFGESYVDGDWDTDDITKVIEWMIFNVERHPTLMADKPKKVAVNIFRFLNKINHKFRDNTLTGSRKNIAAHYDLGNDFFSLFLDPTMTYSAASFESTDRSLEDAQHTKYDKLCQKLKVKPGDHILEIGSGWGGFAIHAAKNFGCRVTTITISREQYEYARKKIEEQGLLQRVDIQIRDYREMTGKFDKIVSIEMIEAVGHRFLPDFFAKCQELLKKDGILGLQMIMSPDHRYESFRKNVDWIQKHIFPGSLLPSMKIIQKCVNQTGTLSLLDFEDMTKSYAKTLSIWRDNFNAQTEKIQSLGFDRAFIRKWNYYFSYCEAAFNMRNISVAQAVFTRPNNLNLN